MNETFKKPCIFITSLGRTGTTFFGDSMSQTIENCTSVDEPDIITGHETLQDMHEKIRGFGLFRVTAGRFFTHYSMRALGVARQRGKLSDEEVVKSLRLARKSILNNLKTKIYLEANLQLCGLTDLLPLAFPNSRVVFIVRDPRSWVSSWMNLGRAIYSSYDVRCRFNGRLTPHHFEADPYKKTWQRMTRFEKLCWAWGRENSYVLNHAEKTDSVKIFRFEDLFCGDNNYNEMTRLLEFASGFSDGFRAEWSLNQELLRKKVNAAERYMFPEWPEWNREQAELLDEHCGDLMKQLGYGCESQWQEKLRQSDREKPTGEAEGV